MTDWSDPADDEDEDEADFDEQMDDETAMLLRAMTGRPLRCLIERLQADTREWESTGVVPDWQRRKYLGYDD